MIESSILFIFSFLSSQPLTHSVASSHRRFVALRVGQQFLISVVFVAVDADVDVDVDCGLP